MRAVYFVLSLGSVLRDHDTAEPSNEGATTYRIDFGFVFCAKCGI